MDMINLDLVHLDEILRKNLPRRFKTVSGSSSFLASYSDDKIEVLTNRGLYEFDTSEILELIIDVTYFGSVKPSQFKGEHKNTSYKLPIIIFVLHLVEYDGIKLPTKSIQFAQDSEISSDLAQKSITEFKEKKDFYEGHSSYNYSHERADRAPRIMRNDKSSILAEEGDSELCLNEQEILEKHFLMDIHFATNRKPANGPAIFGNKKSADLSYGCSQVSIPRNHESGKVERPPFYDKALQIFGVELETTKKHIVIRKCDLVMEGEFLRRVKSKSTALVFIHGFNVNFKDALYQSAQLKKDLAFDGSFVLFSWPSFGDLRGYVGDKERAVSSGPLLADLIEKLNSQGFEQVYILAHSMGSYCLSQAMERLNPTSKLSEIRIALAAPDIAQDDFINLYAKEYINKSSDVTIYTCNRDRALFASRVLHGGERLGQSNPITIVKGMETIDASPVTKFIAMNHSYVFQHNYVLTDLYDFFFNKLTADDRRLKPLPSVINTTHWGLHGV
jgi:esterase/lipase superfamily enzyme